MPFFCTVPFTIAQWLPPASVITAADPASTVELLADGLGVGVGVGAGVGVGVGVLAGSGLTEVPLAVQAPLTHSHHNLLVFSCQMLPFT